MMPAKIEAYQRICNFAKGLPRLMPGNAPQSGGIAKQFQNP